MLFDIVDASVWDAVIVAMCEEGEGELHLMRLPRVMAASCWRRVEAGDQCAGVAARDAVDICSASSKLEIRAVM